MEVLPQPHVSSFLDILSLLFRCSYIRLKVFYLDLLPLHLDHLPVVGGKGDGQEGGRHDGADGREAQGHGAAARHT